MGDIKQMEISSNAAKRPTSSSSVQTELTEAQPAFITGNLRFLLTVYMLLKEHLSSTSYLTSSVLSSVGNTLNT